jgi:hypothetical protein
MVENKFESVSEASVTTLLQRMTPETIYKIKGNKFLCSVCSYVVSYPKECLSCVAKYSCGTCCPYFCQDCASDMAETTISELD